ncbi:hypothetical protein WA158_004576 [Blastocystis sp. Blastoise]
MPRLSGIDMTKGTGILIMILVHAITNNLAENDGKVFYSLLDLIPNWVLYILIYPFVILGLFGTIFTVMTAMTTSFSVMSMCEKEQYNRVLPYIVNKLLFCILLKIMEIIFWTILNEQYDIFLKHEIVFPSFPISNDATTLDSIGWSCFLSPIIIYLLYLCKIKKPLVQIIVLSVFVAISLGISPWVTEGFSFLVDFFHEHNISLFEVLCGKIAIGRFKLSQTFAFVILGCIFAIIYKSKWNIKGLLWYNCGLTILCVSTFVIWALIDGSWLEHIVDEDVPLPGQILCMGLETQIISWHCYFCDGNRKDIKLLASRKRTTYLRRLSMISLTAFCLCPFVGRQIQLFFRIFFGAPCVHGDDAHFLWGVIPCASFVIIDLIIWFCIAYGWEKIHFKYSVEWILGLALATFAGQKNWRMNATDVIYGPIEEIQKKVDDDTKVSLLEEEKIVVTEQPVSQ